MNESKFIRNKYEFISISPVMLMHNSDENRVDIINLLLNDFSTYGILLRDLVNYPLKEQERNLCLNIAYYIIENPDCHQELLEKRILNIRKIARLTKLKINYIKKWKDYIISYWIIFSNPDYKFIQEYLRVRRHDRTNIKEHTNKKEKSYRGIVLKILVHNIAYILTSMGEFKKVKLEHTTPVGNICEGKKFYSKNVLRIPICIFLLIVIIIGVKTYSKYKTTSSIIVIETTSSIKLHRNIFDRVIYSYSPTDKGKKLVESIDMHNKKTDDVIYEIMKYGYKNEMISNENKVYITVTGQNLVYGELIKTSKFAEDNNISVVINNGGVEQKLLKEEKKTNSKEENNKEKNSKQ